jgi:hypothetical protein
MRLRAMGALGFTEVWITELSFGKVEGSEPAKYKALIDGKPQEREYDSVEQIMIEYALSDNDTVGMYDQQALHELISPHANLIPMENYKLELAPPVALKTFNEDYSKAKPGVQDNKKIDPAKVKEELDIKCPKCGFHFKGDSENVEELDDDTTENGPQE